MLIGIILLMLACGSKPQPAPVIGEAYVGPYKLDLIAKLSPKAPVVTTLKHGDHVEILQRRRRFVKVRAENGVTGWVDGRLLLSVSQMAMLRRLSMRAGRLPSQGKATVYDTLNVHTAPNRQAPSFYRLEEGILVEVVAQRPLPRGPYQPAEEDSGPIELNSYAPPATGNHGAGRHDNWSLVRLRDGRAGWVLTRQLVMAIPDEVAQYAEGRRITSYFSLGQVVDHGEIKNHWLWTTLSRNHVPYQFDSFRVFTWSRRRHRYETAHIERNLIGYYPTEVHFAGKQGEGKAPVRFSLIIRDKTGEFHRRIYVFRGYRVRLIETQPWNPPTVKPRSLEPPAGKHGSAAKKSLFDRLKDTLTGLVHFGRSPRH